MMGDAVGSDEIYWETLYHFKSTTSGIAQESEEFQNILYEEMSKMKVQEAMTEYLESAMRQTEQVMQAFWVEFPSLKQEIDRAEIRQDGFSEGGKDLRKDGSGSGGKNVKFNLTWSKGLDKVPKCSGQPDRYRSWKYKPGVFPEGEEPDHNGFLKWLEQMEGNVNAIDWRSSPTRTS